MLNRLWIFFVTLCVFIVGIPLLFLLTIIPYGLLVDFIGGYIGIDLASGLLTGLLIAGFAWFVSGEWLEGRKFREEAIKIQAETEAMRKREDVC